MKIYKKNSIETNFRPSLSGDVANVWSQDITIIAEQHKKIYICDINTLKISCLHFPQVDRLYSIKGNQEQSIIICNNGEDNYYIIKRINAVS